MNGEIFHKLQNEFAGVEDPAAKDIFEKIVISAPWLSEVQLDKEHRNFDAWINGYGPLQEILTDRKITDGRLRYRDPGGCDGVLYKW